MSNDVVFLNNYTEVLFDNFSAVIKQNIQFQTQLKLAEQQLAILDDAKRTADNLTTQNKLLQDKVNDLINLTSSYKDVSNDKSRLQLSLNESSQVKNHLQSQVNDMQQELVRLRTQSEEFIKLKKENKHLKEKLGIVDEEKPVKIKLEKTKPTQATAGTF